VQTFTCTADRLQALRVFAAGLGHPDACTLHVALEDAESSRTLAAHDFDCRALPADPARKSLLVFAFDPIADSRGRSFRLRASSADAQPGAGVGLWCRSDGLHWANVALWRATLEPSLAPGPPPSAAHEKLGQWKLAIGEQALDGTLEFDTTSSRAAFESVRSIGDRTLYRRAGGPMRYHFVGRAIPAANDAQAFARTQSPDFDPARAVVLDAGAAAGIDPVHDEHEPIGVRVVDEQPTKIELELPHAEAGWLVTAKPWYPGWVARVDGEERAVLRANYAFIAVRVANGEKRIELSYEPRSFRRGLWVSAWSTLGLALFLTLLALRSRAAA
jgi:hypothetical protein